MTSLPSASRKSGTEGCLRIHPNTEVEEIFHLPITMGPMAIEQARQAHVARATAEGEPCSKQTPHLRADASRNRASIVCAAAAAFAEQGTDVGLEEIARRAGVGIATLYRRFPTRDALIETVLDETMRHYADRTEAAAEQAMTEPWEAFSSYLMFVMEHQATDPAFADTLAAPQFGSQIFAAQLQRAFDAWLVLTDRVRAAGVVRPDFHQADLHLLILANAGVARATRLTAPQAWRRLAAYMLDAFRHDTGEALPAVPSLWERAVRGSR
jgi:AcrR family transcriptional regulator